MSSHAFAPEKASSLGAMRTTEPFKAVSISNHKAVSPRAANTHTVFVVQLPMIGVLSASDELVRLRDIGYRIQPRARELGQRMEKESSCALQQDQ
jgi:hypothetical protein